MPARRLSLRKALPLAALLAGGAPLAAQDGFARWEGSGSGLAEARQLAESELYPAGRPELAFTLDATVLFDRGSSWTQARAIRQLRKTAAIFATCGVAIGELTLVRLALPASERRIDTAQADPQTGVPPGVARLAERLPAGTAYPAAFLVGRVSGADTLAVSYRAREAGSAGEPYFDTAWIGYQSHWLPRRDERYSPLAHEFAHLLCRCGHTRTDRRHLLHSARNFLSADVLADDCSRIRGSPLLTPND